MDQTLEILFERFRTTGDPDALAAVYDRVAVRLLRLGIHLTRDQAQAEDLLQATFVAAIESAPAFDRKRPLLPWLMGILANQARKLAARALPPAPDTAGEPLLDPRQEAELEELSRALDHAIEQVPEVHRPVLVLKLKHGLTPAEIAHALDRAPGTVRVQLHRGLEQLRALLPAGFALSALLVITPARGLAAVRGAILAGLPTHTVPALAVAGVGGWLLMNKLLVSVAAILVTGVVGYVVWAPGPPLGVVAEAALPGAGTPAVASRAAVESAPSPALAPAAAQRTAVEDKAAGTPGRTTTTITGRCVAEESGAPLTAGEAKVDRVPPVRLDPEGRFRIELERPDARGFTLVVAPDGRVPRTGFVDPMKPGSARDLGELRFCVGSLVSGVVREASGAPVPEARLDVSFSQKPLFGAASERGSAAAMTDAQGRFRLSQRLPAGSHPFKLPEDCEPVGRPRLVVPEGGGDVAVEITVRRAPIAGKVTGVVLDDAGQPFRGARVVATRVDALMPAPVAQARTGAEGAFELILRGSGLDRVRIEVTSREGLQDPDPEREVRLDAQLTVRMVRAAGLEITVREAATGRPVEEYAIVLTPKAWRRTMSISPKFDGRHAAGVLVVTDERPGEYSLRVLPKDRPRLRIADNLPVTIQAGARTQVTVDVQVSLEATVSLRLPKDAPVAGSRVQLIRPGVLAEQIERMEEIGREGMVWNSSGLRVTVVLDEAITDAQGDARLSVAPDEPELVLRALGPGHVPAVRRGLKVVAGGPPIRLMVSRGAGLEARLRPVSVLAALDYLKDQRERSVARRPETASLYDRRRPGLALRRAGDSSPQAWLPGLDAAFPADDRGVVRADGLQPGTYDVFARWWDARLRKLEGKAPLATVTVREEDPASLDLDIGALLPGSLAARVLLDGEPLGSSDLDLPPASLQLQTDGEGRFSIPALDAGRYRVVVRTGDGKPRAGAGLQSDEEVVIEPGEATADFVFHLRSRTVRLQVLKADGSPAASLRLALFGGPSRIVTTDAEGVVHLREVPHGSFEVRQVPDDVVDQIQETPMGVMGQIGLLPSLGRVQVPIAETEVRATLQLR